jgi:hypothetical protein
MKWRVVMRLYKLRIALASTILALAAVSATANSASARPRDGDSFQRIVGSEPTSFSGLRRAIMIRFSSPALTSDKSGYSLEQMGALLAHTRKGVTAVYARWDPGPSPA